MSCQQLGRGTDRRELRLLSQVLGLSTLVLAQNQGKKTGCTEAVEFYQPPAHQPVVHDLGSDISANALGPRGYISGTVRNTQGQPVPYATLEVGFAGNDGIAADRHALLQSDERGHYHFSMRLPDGPRLPSDGPLGSPPWIGKGSALPIYGSASAPLGTNA
ncbi:hypothetical protein [Pseudomonas cerasi]|uniref:Intradiol ring-cleavage dioxygenase n=1 Tax=Pseudomonas cerasi TaxID=1583341 RepID=A0A193SSS9_9PSED|nr:hypothetical protein [Pseudomonas cerasi]CZT30129.1 hypothetical protein PCPL58_3673 [Pseudomonas cerasi]SOS21850.1 hypothetical protein PL963_03763 [Pseudomonas cerasi]